MRDAFGRSNPKSSVTSFKESLNPVARQAVGGGEGAELAVSVLDKSAGGAGPQTAIARGNFASDEIIANGRHVTAVEISKPDAVKTGKAILGANPDVVVASLRDGLGGALDETGLIVPAKLPVLSDEAVWIEGQQRPTQGYESDEGEDSRHRG